VWLVAVRVAARVVVCRRLLAAGRPNAGGALIARWTTKRAPPTTIAHGNITVHTSTTTPVLAGVPRLRWPNATGAICAYLRILRPLSPVLLLDTSALAT